MGKMQSGRDESLLIRDFLKRKMEDSRNYVLTVLNFGLDVVEDSTSRVEGDGFVARQIKGFIDERLSFLLVL